MDIEKITLWLCLVYCLAMTSGIIFLFYRSQRLKKINSFRILQYFIVMFYAYGLYALWGEEFFTLSVLPLLVNNQDHLYIAEFLILLASPFLIIGLIANLLWSFRIVSGAKSGWSLALAILTGLVLFYFSPPIGQGLRQVNTGLVVLVFCYSAYLIALSGNKLLSFRERLLISLSLILIAFIHYLIQSPYIVNVITALALIFLFFLLITFIAIYFFRIIQSATMQTEADASEPENFDVFVKTYGITKRESEIIREIYKGKTNQEIADSLFVAVQTVKDHTHRIFRKTQVSNRTQLASLLRRYHKPDIPPELKNNSGILKK